MLDTAIGPIHYGTSNDQEIDTAWQVDTGAWQYKMTLAGYNAHARSVLNVGDVIEYRDPISNQYVLFQPLGLNWVDNVTNSRQQIALPQAVTATVNDDKLIWTNGYGTGQHFSWQAQSARLFKVLTLDSPSTLPLPTVSNPYLEIEFITTYSNDIDIYIDGQEWNKRDRRITGSKIEFRNTVGQTLWHYRAPLARDSGTQYVTGLIELTKRGGSFYATVRFPKTFIDSAIWPVYLDTTVDYDTVSATDDGCVATGAFVDDKAWTGYYYASYGNWIRFPSVSGLSGVTINVSYASFSGNEKLGSPNVRIYANDTAAPTAPTSESNYDSKTLTTEYAAWTTGLTTPSLNNVLQELADSYDPSAIMLMCKDNGSAANENVFLVTATEWDGAHTLHIEYTAGGGPVNITAAENNQAQKSDAAVLGVYTPATPSQQNQAQKSDLASLSLATTALTAAENNQAQVSDAVSLSAEAPTYQLSAAENNQAQVSDLATLGVFTPISAAENNQAQISDAASLTAEAPTYNISPAENNQAQVSDAATMGVFTPVAPAENNQAQVSDLASLSILEPTISIAEGNQAQVSDAATMGVYTPIAPAECNQGQASDAASLSILGATRWTTYWKTQFDQDQEAWVTLAHIAGTIRLWGRMVNPEGGGVNLRGYFAEYAGGTVTAHRYNDATTTDEGLGTAAVTLADGDKLWLRLEGEQVSVYTYQSGAWSQRISVTDASPALEDGYIGFDVTDSSAILDDFGGGALTVDLTAAENNQAQVSDAASLTAEAPTVNITADDNNQAQVSDAASLTAEAPTYNVTVAENNQAQVSDAASLSAEAPTYNISPAENNQAQTSDAVTFDSIVYALSAAENNQAQKSDLAILTSGEISVTAADNNQAQVSDAVTITAIYPFTGAENNQAQVSDAVTISAYYPVTAADNNQVQVSDAASLSVLTPGTTNITAADNNQAQVSDLAILGVYHPVSASEQNQAQVSDLAVLTAEGPTYAITVADNWQAQTSDAVTFSSLVYPISAMDNRQAQVSDLAVLSLTGVFEHGERRLYAFDTRGSSVFDARGSSVFATRVDLEVND